MKHLALPHQPSHQQDLQHKRVGMQTTTATGVGPGDGDPTKWAEAELEAYMAMLPVPN